jgi:hypothetical protein
LFPGAFCIQWGKRTHLPTWPYLAHGLKPQAIPRP